MVLDYVVWSVRRLNWFYKSLVCTHWVQRVLSWIQRVLDVLPWVPCTNRFAVPIVPLLPCHALLGSPGLVYAGTGSTSRRSVSLSVAIIALKYTR